jgi:hypothetical protein
VKRITGLIAVVMFGCALLMLTTVSYARSLPDEAPLQTFGLDLCRDRRDESADKKPCYLHTTPGVTSWQGTRSFFSERAEPTTQTGMFVLPLGNVGDGYARFTSSLDRRTVAHIMITDRSARLLPRVVYFINFYGAPCGVRWGDTPNDMVLVYPYMELYVPLEAGRLTPYAKVRYMTIKDTEYAATVPYALCDSNPTRRRMIVPWTGFASLGQYIAAGLPLWE